MSDNFNAFSETVNPYPFPKQGSYGRFATMQSFPIDYLLTTFASHELKDLTFARQIKQEELDFSLLLQREIDEDRVKDEIKPYLNSNDKKSIFFPPLLVAVLPVKGEKLEDYYPSCTTNIVSKNLVREYEELFKLTHVQGAGSLKYNISVLNKGLEESYDILREPCKLELNFSKGAKIGCRLVVIDGQHRLKALQDVYDSSPEILESLAVPVCILFPPKATEEYRRLEHEQGREIPSIREIFRQLFVDVNNTAERVGGHFNILLSESNISSIICREFCSEVLEKKESYGLALVEWNQKKHKLSTEITGKYTITSIGVIDQALNDFVGTSTTVYEYLLNFASDVNVLDPDDESSPHLKKAEWNRFTVVQKRDIESRVRKLVVPHLMNMFFEVKEYKKCFDIFMDVFNSEVQSKITADYENKIAYEIVKHRVLEYIPIPEDRKNSIYSSANAYFESFSKKVNSRFEEEVSPIIRKNVFQNAMIFSWVELIKVASKHQLDVSVATSVLVKCIDESLEGKGKLFNYTNNYIQNFIYNTTRIVAAKDTIKGLSYLILGQLVKDEVQKSTGKIIGMDIEERKVSNFVENVRQLGEKSLNNYTIIFSRKYTKYIEKSYQLLGSPFSDDEREELRLAHDTKKLHQKEVRENIRPKAEVSDKFDKLVEKYVKLEVNKVQEELIKIYDLKLDIFGLTNGDEE